MEERTVIKALAALVQPMRLRAFGALGMVGQAGLTPGTMADGLQAPAATLSFHLNELTNAGLVTQERSGRPLIYRADYGCMSEVLAYLTENCCQGEPCVADAGADCTCCRRSASGRPARRTGWT
jgi:ArsR family transcriptional regulator